MREVMVEVYRIHADEGVEQFASAEHTVRTGYILHVRDAADALV